MKIAPIKVTVREAVAAETHADNVKTWHLGGKTAIGNGRMLCAAHNLAKGGVW